MMKIASKVAASIPVTTTVPRMRREAAPDPVANHSGAVPRMNANDVIRIGRSRSRAPSSAASTSGFPSSSRAFANSTIRIAFFAARPISMMTPICEYTSKS
jgi:hypothetical protein